MPVSQADLVRQWGPIAAGMKDDLPNVQYAYPNVPMQPASRGVDMPQLGEHRYSEHLGGYANQPWYAEAIDPTGEGQPMAYSIPATGKEGSIPVGSAWIAGQADADNVGHELLHLNPALSEDNTAQHDLIDVLRSYDSGSLGASDTLAGVEHSLGAQLGFDPSRGHGVDQVVDAATSPTAGSRDDYIKYRNAAILRQGQ